MQSSSPIHIVFTLHEKRSFFNCFFHFSKRMPMDNQKTPHEAGFFSDFQDDY